HDAGERPLRLTGLPGGQDPSSTTRCTIAHNEITDLRRRRPECRVITGTPTPCRRALRTGHGVAWVMGRATPATARPGWASRAAWSPRAGNTAVPHVHPPLEHVICPGDVRGAGPPGVTYEDSTSRRRPGPRGRAGKDLGWPSAAWSECPNFGPGADPATLERWALTVEGLG